ncbi:MAG: Trk family potassium uptake protein [Thermomicrobiales bacterium]|nr:Trk family potassium uptake protein [Thermomicrobiales bacterium]
MSTQRPRSRFFSILAPPAPGPGGRANASVHSQVFLAGLFAITLIGTTLLATPWVTADGSRTPVIDAFFTAVSAASVSGLAVVDTLEHWNLAGQIVVLLLVQIGGLGFMVGANILLQMLRRGMGSYTLRDELLLRDGAPTLSINEAVSLARHIFWFMIVVESAGAAFLTLWFLFFAQLPLLEAVWQGVFYSITAFCNAGFDVSRVAAHTDPATDPILNLLLIALMQLGAISFMVCKDVFHKRAWRPLSLDSKIVLGLNGALLLAGTLVFLATEWGEALAGVPPASKALVSLFQSASARSAGFNSVDWSLVNPLTLFFWLGLMFVGGASGSTSGGVRLNTVGVVLAAVASTLRGHAETQLWGRRIAAPLVFRAVTVIVIFLLVYGLGAAGLSAAEHQFSHRETPMIELMFEAMSALATVGLSTGITPGLTAVSKIILCVLMFVGHLGPLVTVYALQRRQRPHHYRFPEEAVRIG